MHEESWKRFVADQRTEDLIQAVVHLSVEPDEVLAIIVPIGTPGPECEKVHRFFQHALPDDWRFFVAPADLEFKVLKQDGDENTDS